MYLENYILKYKTSNQISKKQTQTIETLNDCDATQSEADRDCEGDKRQESDCAAPVHLENPSDFLDEKALLMQSIRQKQSYESKLSTPVFNV